ncbi:acyltransferase [Synechococcus sp. 1G10]|uniref:acyltransferase n=1 Tax=Synechococcus sp. 1G10 TaxID=2025605 RepID=UPI0018E9C506|nr:acyltransferase [Synechococcus sp. 1G10]
MMRNHPADHRQLEHDWYDGGLPDNVRLDEGCWLHSSYAFLHYASQRPCGVSIGKASGIYRGTFFNLGLQGEVRIGHYCTLRGVIINTNGLVDIDDYALIAHQVVISDAASAIPPARSNRKESEVAPEAAGETTRQPTIRIGRNAWIGCGAVLLAGADIGMDAIVAAGSSVNGPVPAGTLAIGNPYQLRPLKQQRS